jgi:hypothetical protein
MQRLERPSRDDPITAEWGAAIVDALNELMDGPKIAPPLTLLDGVIGFGDHYRIRPAKTTSAIGARSGTTWGSGAATFITVDDSGVESAVGGFPAFTAWNYTGGSITVAGTRILVAWICGKWVVLSADCSGAP